MSRDEIELFVGDVSDIEARVYARYRPKDGVTSDESVRQREPIMLCGTLRGPYCETAHTLPAEYAFRDAVTDIGPDESALAEAVVPDPCLWSLELPHLYHADVVALRGQQVLAELHEEIGLRRASPRPRDRE